MNTNIKKNKYLKFFIMFYVLGIIISIFYFYNIDKDKINIIVTSIKENNLLLNPINNIINHLKILSVTSLFTMIFIGIPIFIGLIISEGFISFFRFIVLYKTYKMKGIIFGLIYYILNNLFYIIFLYIIFRKLIILAKKIYRLIIKKENINFSEIYNILHSIIYIIIIIFIIDSLTFFYTPKILKIFAFLLK